MTALAVPAYFHPIREAADWARLCAADRLGLVVVNPDSGVGPTPDIAYHPVCAALRTRFGVAVAGYIDTAYAARPLREVLDEVTAYRRFYGIDAVFVDQVTSGVATLGYYVRLAQSLRIHCAGPIVLNPGVSPDPGYRAIADVVVTFEGPWSVYRRPRARDPRGPGRTWHLVHGTPADQQQRAWRRARHLGAGYAYVTDRRMPNPWDGLPGWVSCGAGG